MKKGVFRYYSLPFLTCICNYNAISNNYAYRFDLRFSLLNSYIFSMFWRISWRSLVAVNGPRNDMGHYLTLAGGVKKALILAGCKDGS